MRVALVSREVHPLAGGGIGEFVAAAARLLSRVAEVTILTASRYREAYERLMADGDPRLPPASVRVGFVEEPSADELGGWYDEMHCYGARILDRLRALYPDGGPDVIEFPDFLAEAFVTVQAARALDPFLAHTCVCVRIHTSAEITEVLNGYRHPELSRQVVYAMERLALGHADRVIWPLGDVLGAYRRFYGDRLAPAVKIGYPYAGAAVATELDREYRTQAPMRLLFVGRLERRKGVNNLVRAARGLNRDDFRLTLLGGDTATGPLGVSMEELLRLTIADDWRFELGGPGDRVQVEDAIRTHDLLVVPSLWECGPYVALEALHLNRPVIGTPVGGLVEIVRPGASGWIAGDSDTHGLARALNQALDSTGEVEALVRSGELVQHARELCDERRILDRYQELARVKPRTRRRVRTGTSQPLVSAIVPYYRSSRYVADTVRSLLAQHYPRIEIVLVNDGSFEDEDWVLAELAAGAPIVVVSQMNSGLGAARNFGLSQCRGRYVFPLDADNTAHPEFVERCVEILEHHHEVAYATSWSRYVQEDGEPRPGPLGYQPLGNEPVALLAEEDVAGDAAAMIRRRIFDLGFRYSEELTACEDWHFYRELGAAGRFGTVIPERLLDYRVRADSMQAEIGVPRRARILEEIESLMRENETQWVRSDSSSCR